MRMTDSGIDKLFDLMTMPFKYQLMYALAPAGPLYVTLNHIEEVAVRAGYLHAFGSARCTQWPGIGSMPGAKAAQKPGGQHQRR